MLPKSSVLILKTCTRASDEIACVAGARRGRGIGEIRRALEGGPPAT